MKRRDAIKSITGLFGLAATPPLWESSSLTSRKEKSDADKLEERCKGGNVVIQGEKFHLDRTVRLDGDNITICDCVFDYSRVKKDKGFSCTVIAIGNDTNVFNCFFQGAC